MLKNKEFPGNQVTSFHYSSYIGKKQSLKVAPDTYKGERR